MSFVQKPPPGVHRRALAAIEAHFRGRPRAYLKTLATWSGRPSDDNPPATSMMPWCRLTLLGGPVAAKVAGLRTTHQERGRLVIQLATAGSNQDDLGDLWDAIHATLFPADADEAKALECRLLGAGVHGLTLIQPALPQSLDDLGQSAVQGIGLIEVLMIY